jgi:hypothetical protein
MTLRILLLLPVCLAVLSIPRVVPATETAETPGAAADNAAVSPSAPEPAAAPAQKEEESPPVVTAPAGDNAAAIDNTWVDRSHGFVEMCLFTAVDWCDRLFGSESFTGAEEARAAVWWKNDFRYDGLQHYTFRTAFRASIRLPRLTRNLRLVIAAENQGDPTAAIPVDPGTPGANVASPTRASSAGLVYDLFRTPRAFFNIGGGVQVRASPDAYARARFQYVQPLGAGTLGRFTTTGAYHAREGPGVSNQLDFERRISPETMLLWANSASLSEETNGWAWGTELSLSRMLSGKSSVKIGGSVRGATRPSFEVQNYRVYTGYRRAILRSWLFWELEPDVNWPLRDDGARDLVWGATMRFEIYFLGAGEAKRIAPPPPLPPMAPPEVPKGDG